MEGCFVARRTWRLVGGIAMLFWIWCGSFCCFHPWVFVTHWGERRLGVGRHHQIHHLQVVFGAWPLLEVGVGVGVHRKGVAVAASSPVLVGVDPFC